MSRGSIFMSHKRRALFAIVVVLTALIAGCSKNNGSSKNEEPDGRMASEEESGAVLALNESYDMVRNGARLTLTYDAQSNSFKGTVENTTQNTLQEVRVEVHLSNGVELGPTTPTDLEPGKKININLTATSKDFDGWTAHPEVGRSEGGEHEHDEEDGEHSKEDRNEHK